VKDNLALRGVAKAAERLIRRRCNQESRFRKSSDSRTVLRRGYTRSLSYFCNWESFLRVQVHLGSEVPRLTLPFTTLDDSEWRDGRNSDKPVWSRRILVRASNNGWRDGVISDFSLEEVRLAGDTETTVIKNPEDGVLKTELEHFSESGEMTRLEVDQRTNYKGQIVGGRDDELMGVVPFILQESELGESMKKAQSGDFKFSATVEDNKKIYSTSIEVSASLEDSAGGKLGQ